MMVHYHSESNLFACIYVIITGKGEVTITRSFFIHFFCGIRPLQSHILRGAKPLVKSCVSFLVHKADRSRMCFSCSHTDVKLFMLLSLSLSLFLLLLTPPCSLRRNVWKARKGRRSRAEEEEDSFSISGRNWDEIGGGERAVSGATERGRRRDHAE